MHDLILLPVTLFLVFFVAGEISAVLALDHRHATQSEHWRVMASLIVMPIIAALTAVEAASFLWAREIPDCWSRDAANGATDTAAPDGRNGASHAASHEHSQSQR
jgi:hypothetical protein